MPKRHPSILVVDDSETNRSLLEDRLKRESFHVLTACNGQEALDLIDGHIVDLVLLDLIMPGLDGLEVLRRLRLDYSAAELPIIMVTSQSDSSDVTAAIYIGANDYVTKPVDLPVLLARLRAQLLRKEAEQALAFTNETLEEQVAARTRELEQSVRALSEQIIERDKMERALLESEQRLRTIVDNAPVEIYLKDLHGRHILVNPQCEVFYQTSAEDILGKTTPELIPEEYAKISIEHDQQVLKENRAVELEFECSIKERMHSFRSIKFVIPNSDGTAAGIGHYNRYHGPAIGRGTASSGPENGGNRTANRWCRPRFQQPSYRDHGKRTNAPAANGWQRGPGSPS